MSKLKIIKTYLRSTMAQERLGNLAILSTEKEVFNSVDFDQIIDSLKKSQEKPAFKLMTNLKINHFFQSHV